MVKAQNGDDLKSSTMTFGVNKQSKPKPVQTQRIDLRQQQREAVKPSLVGVRPVYPEKNQENPNRFVKNILKKTGTGQARGQQNGLQKKRVNFVIGTGTRGQSGRDISNINDSNSGMSFGEPANFNQS